MPGPDTPSARGDGAGAGAKACGGNPGIIPGGGTAKFGGCIDPPPGAAGNAGGCWESLPGGGIGKGIFGRTGGGGNPPPDTGDVPGGGTANGGRGNGMPPRDAAPGTERIKHIVVSMSNNGKKERTPKTKTYVAGAFLAE